MTPPSATDDRQGTVTRITAAPRFRGDVPSPDPDGEAVAEAPAAELSTPADTEAYTRAASLLMASQLTVAIPASKALDDTYVDQLLAGEAAGPRAEAATSPIPRPATRSTCTSMRSPLALRTPPAPRPPRRAAPPSALPPQSARRAGSAPQKAICGSQRIGARPPPSPWARSRSPAR